MKNKLSTVSDVTLINVKYFPEERGDLSVIEKGDLPFTMVLVKKNLL